jgi:hypothetical protein
LLGVRGFGEKTAVSILEQLKLVYIQGNQKVKQEKEYIHPYIPIVYLFWVDTLGLERKEENFQNMMNLNFFG